MDPAETLRRAETLLKEGWYRDSKETLEHYFEWRRAGGFEPKDGDARARKMATCSLEEILLSMDPCDEAREWILNEKSNFGTLAQAVSACPRISWLEWVTEGLPSARHLASDLDNHMSGPVFYSEVRVFLLVPENLERLALGLFDQAKESGLLPRPRDGGAMGGSPLRPQRQEEA